MSFVYLAWGRSSEVLPLPSALHNGREKGGVADDCPPGQVILSVLCGHLCELEKTGGVP